jgi:uncharacterized protein YecT (DUF1311 family)
MRGAAQAASPVVLCLAVAVAGGPAFAISEESLDCLGRAQDVKARLACAEAELAVQNKALAAAVQRARTTLDQRGLELLQRAQQSWEAFREAHCAWMVDRLRKNPDAQRIERALCLATAAEARAQEIDEYQTVP